MHKRIVAVQQALQPIFHTGRANYRALLHKCIILSDMCFDSFHISAVAAAMQQCARQCNCLVAHAAVGFHIVYRYQVCKYQGTRYASEKAYGENLLFLCKSSPGAKEHVLLRRARIYIH